MELFAWRRDTAGESDVALVGRVQLDDAGARLVESHDPELARALSALLEEPYLPLTVREVVNSQRHVRCERKTPEDPGYWAALADALQRATGLAITTSDQPPA